MDFIVFGIRDLALIVALGVVLPVIVGMYVVLFIRKAHQARCTHEYYYENGQCDAECRGCGKNLGLK